MIHMYGMWVQNYIYIYYDAQWHAESGSQWYRDAHYNCRIGAIVVYRRAVSSVLYFIFNCTDWITKQNKS